MFRQRLDNIIRNLAQKGKRIPVAFLPQSVRAARERHAAMLESCRDDLKEDDVELILQLLNDDWTQTMTCDQSLVHVCGPGCCSSERNFRQRLYKALDAMLGHVYPTPLLYRSVDMQHAL